MIEPQRIVFAGSPEFARPVLAALLASRHDVVAVLTQPDRPTGRGRRLVSGPIKQAAEEASIPVLQPIKLDSAAQAELRALQPDLLVVVAYGLLLAPEVLEIPRLGCLNVHASLLPRWRGASPIQTAILHGDSCSGVCLMKMDTGLDTGPVYSSLRAELTGNETAGELHDRLARLGGELVTRDLDAIVAGELLPAPQAADGVTYAGKISKQDGRIDWSMSAVAIDRQIRAYNPWPVAQTTLEGELLRCWKSHADAVATRESPGTIIAADAEGIAVQTGDGVLVLEEVQAAGRKRVSAREFSNARQLSGRVLGR